MLIRVVKIAISLSVSFMFTISLFKLVLCIHNKYFNDDSLEFNGGTSNEVDNWLKENGLGQYKDLFHANGKCL